MVSLATQRLKLREVGPAAHLPYLRHATEHVVTLATRALITCLRIEGVSFETADPAELNDLHAKLNLALRNVADERLALWTHVVRRRSQETLDRRRRPRPTRQNRRGNPPPLLPRHGYSE